MPDCCQKQSFCDAVMGSKDAIPIGMTARVLNCGMGQNKLFSFLRENKILMANNQPYQKYIDEGWFRCIESKYDYRGETHIYIKPVLFQKRLKENPRNDRWNLTVSMKGESLGTFIFGSAWTHDCAERDNKRARARRRCIGHAHQRHSCRTFVPKDRSLLRYPALPCCGHCKYISLFSTSWKENGFYSQAKC